MVGKQDLLNTIFLDYFLKQNNIELYLAGFEREKLNIGEKIKLLIKLIRRLRNKFKWILFKCLDWLLTVK